MGNHRMSTITVKVSLGDDVRRLTLSSLQSLHLELASRFATSHPLTLRWLDEDEDLVTLHSEDDLHEAITASSEGNLRIIATLENNSEFSSCNQPSTSQPQPQTAEELMPPGHSSEAPTESPSHIDEDTTAATLQAHIRGVLSELGVLPELETSEDLVKQLAAHLASAPPCMAQGLIARLEHVPESPGEPSAALCVHLAGLFNTLNIDAPNHLVVKAAGALTQFAPMMRANLPMLLGFLAISGSSRASAFAGVPFSGCGSGEGGVPPFMQAPMQGGAAHPMMDPMMMGSFPFATMMAQAQSAAQGGEIVWQTGNNETAEAMQEDFEAAQRVAEEAECVERVAVLVNMGFSKEEAKGALEITKGSVERAADLLLAC